MKVAMWKMPIESNEAVLGSQWPHSLAKAFMCRNLDCKMFSKKQSFLFFHAEILTMMREGHMSHMSNPKKHSLWLSKLTPKIHQSINHQTHLWMMFWVKRGRDKVGNLSPSIVRGPSCGGGRWSADAGNPVDLGNLYRLFTPKCGEK